MPANNSHSSFLLKKKKEKRSRGHVLTQVRSTLTAQSLIAFNYLSEDKALPHKFHRTPLSSEPILFYSDTEQTHEQAVDLA